MASKHIFILNYIYSDSFESNANIYKNKIDEKNITLDDLVNHILNDIWNNNKFDFWCMDFNLMRYYRQYTRDLLIKKLGLLHS